MKWVIWVLMVVGVDVSVFGAATPSQTPPPGPRSDWTQGDCNNVSPMPNGSMQFGGSMRGPGFTSPGGIDIQQWIADVQRQMEQMQAQVKANKESNIRHALGVNDAQWAQIKSRLDRIEQLKAEVNACISPNGSLGGGSGMMVTTMSGNGRTGGGFSFGSSGRPGPNGTQFQSWNSLPAGGSAQPTETGSLCQKINGLLLSPNVPAGQISQKIAVLRQAREQAQRDLTRERKELRALLNFRQEASLIVMGYLD